uniref:serine/threonine-protein kinase WNK1-like n=1 Tax=Myxine glutinosa TaxID=7769 RepID=UPI00358FD5D4
MVDNNFILEAERDRFIDQMKEVFEKAEGILHEEGVDAHGSNGAANDGLEQQAGTMMAVVSTENASQHSSQYSAAQSSCPLAVTSSGTSQQVTIVQSGRRRFIVSPVVDAEPSQVPSTSPPDSQQDELGPQYDLSLSGSTGDLQAAFDHALKQQHSPTAQQSINNGLPFDEPKPSDPGALDATAQLGSAESVAGDQVRQDVHVPETSGSLPGVPLEGVSSSVPVATSVETSGVGVPSENSKSVQGRFVHHSGLISDDVALRHAVPGGVSDVHEPQIYRSAPKVVPMVETQQQSSAFPVAPDSVTLQPTLVPQPQATQNMTIYDSVLSTPQASTVVAQQQPFQTPQQTHPQDNLSTHSQSHQLQPQQQKIPQQPPSTQQHHSKQPQPAVPFAYESDSDMVHRHSGAEDLKTLSQKLRTLFNEPPGVGVLCASDPANKEPAVGVAVTTDPAQIISPNKNLAFVPSTSVPVSTAIPVTNQTLYSQVVKGPTAGMALGPVQAAAQVAVTQHGGANGSTAKPPNRLPVQLQSVGSLDIQQVKQVPPSPTAGNAGTVPSQAHVETPLKRSCSFDMAQHPSAPIYTQSNITDPGKQSVWIGPNVTSTLPAVTVAPTVATAVEASRSGGGEVGTSQTVVSECPDVQPGPSPALPTIDSNVEIGNTKPTVEAQNNGNTAAILPSVSSQTNPIVTIRGRFQITTTPELPNLVPPAIDETNQPSTGLVSEPAVPPDVQPPCPPGGIVEQCSSSAQVQDEVVCSTESSSSQSPVIPGSPLLSSQASRRGLEASKASEVESRDEPPDSVSAGSTIERTLLSKRPSTETVCSHTDILADDQASWGSFSSEIGTRPNMDEPGCIRTPEPYNHSPSSCMSSDDSDDLEEENELKKQLNKLREKHMAEQAELQARQRKEKEELYLRMGKQPPACLQQSNPPSGRRRRISKSRNKSGSSKHGGTADAVPLKPTVLFPVVSLTDAADKDPSALQCSETISQSVCICTSQANLSSSLTTAMIKPLVHESFYSGFVSDGALAQGKAKRLCNGKDQSLQEKHLDFLSWRAGLGETVSPVQSTQALAKKATFTDEWHKLVDNLAPTVVSNTGQSKLSLNQIKQNMQRQELEPAPSRPSVTDGTVAAQLSGRVYPLPTWVPAGSQPTAAKPSAPIRPTVPSPYLLYGGLPPPPATTSTVSASSYQIQRPISSTLPVTVATTTVPHPALPQFHPGQGVAPQTQAKPGACVGTIVQCGSAVPKTS